MIVKNENYTKYVTEDLKYHKGLSHPVDSSIFLRIKSRQIDIKKLHPNPEDEFSTDSVGPNWEIVADYEKTIRFNMEVDLDIFSEPLYAVKLDKGGYMLLNGHHRWLAALDVNVKKVPVKIVNITTDEHVYNVINKSKRDKCVTIDLDEVLLTSDNKLRENSSLLIREFGRMGYDVWTYTGSYLSNRYIKWLFFCNKCKIDGVVNGLNGKKNSLKLKNIFREKYTTIVHVDNEMLTFVNTQNKKYEIIDINATNEEWASVVAEAAHNFDMNVLND